MANKLYVGNLNFRTDEQMLSSLFAQFGQVESAVVIKDRETQRSKGFGFVTFTEEQSLQKAIDALNGKEVDGRKIRVSVAEERPPRQNRPLGGFHRS
ncbi:MAG TPA: RNA-binding protein [Treponema sp.]|nr:RNA-binding protein [Treponema sp.]